MSISIKICKGCRKKQGMKLLKKLKAHFPDILYSQHKCLKKCKGNVLKIKIKNEAFLIVKLRKKSDRKYLLKSLDSANPALHLKKTLGHLIK